MTINAEFITALSTAVVALIAAIGSIIKMFLDARTQSKRFDDLESQFKAQVKINAGLNAENQELHDQIAALATSITERDNQVGKLQGSFDFLLIEYKRQTDKNEMFTAQVGELRSRNDVLQQKYDALQRQYDELCKENEELRRQLAAVQKKQTGSLKE